MMNAFSNDFTNFEEQQLSYIGPECFCVPRILGNIYGNQAKRLDMSFNSLRKLDGLEMFPYLEELILDNNNLDDSVRFALLPHLHTLSLNKNNFVDLDSLLRQLLNCFPNLRYFSLLGNPACPDQLSNSEKDESDYRRYRCYVLYHIPGLRFLDSTPVTDSERLESQIKGNYMRVVRPLADETEHLNVDRDSETLGSYTPLPSNIRKEGNHRGSFGKLRQHYAGTQSEGNRFIRDNEL